MSEAEWWRMLFLSLTRSMCLADHLGDAWEAFHAAWKLAGIGELPLTDTGDVDFDAIVAMGGRSFWAGRERPIPQRPTEVTGG